MARTSPDTRPALWVALAAISLCAVTAAVQSPAGSPKAGASVSVAGHAGPRVLRTVLLREAAAVRGAGAVLARRARTIGRIRLVNDGAVRARRHASGVGSAARAVRVAPARQPGGASAAATSRSDQDDETRRRAAERPSGGAFVVSPY